jgi:hypothetical protein
LLKHCEECGEEINPKRVAVFPKVRLCLDCQSKMEKTGRHQRHKMSVDIRFKGDEIESYDQTIVRGDNEEL